MSLVTGAIGRAATRSAVCTLLLVFAASSLQAAPANPNPFTDRQPDGTRVTLRLRGDEHWHWMEDLDGYTVLRNRGWLEYARLNPQGRLVPSGLKVGLDNPQAQGLGRGLQPAPSEKAKGQKSGSGSDTGSYQAVAPRGPIRNLVVLVRFANHTDRSLPSTFDIDVLFNAPGGDPVLAPTGSVRDVYLANSYGQMELNSDISGWVTVSGTEQYYANGNSGDSTLWEALREALTLVDQYVDFRDYDSNGDGYIDSIAFLHSGYGAEWGGTDAYGTPWQDRIWSHRWAIQNPPWTSEEGITVSDYHISPAVWGTSGAKIGRIGVIAHETGHFFGLPDLYDTDGGGQGSGSWELMANSWDFQATQLCPPHLSPWSKMQLGWIDPVEITSGQFTIGQSETNDAYYVIRQGFPSGEYLLIENRQPAGFDCTVPQGGLAIWHIDDQAGFNTEGYPGGRWPKDGKHYRVALAQADGNFDLEHGWNRGDAGDVHHAAGVDAMAPGPENYPNTDAYQNGRIVVTGHVISNISASGASMTFCLNDCGGSGGGGGDGGTFAAPDNLVASVNTSGRGNRTTADVVLTWADNSSGTANEDAFEIERCEETGKGKSKTCSFALLATVPADTTTFGDAVGSGTYIYRIRARRGSEYSGYSNEVKI